MPTNQTVSTFCVLDFDRTIANTDKLYRIFEQVVRRETDSRISSQLDQAREAAEKEGGSFEAVDYLRRILTKIYGDDTWQPTLQAFIATAKQEDTLEPGAKELIQRLDAEHIPYGIITYGNEAWQLAKLEGSKLMTMPHLVTRIKEKGRLLTGWKHGGSTFIIPPAMTRDFAPLEVDTIVFLDDKAVSFQDLPEGVKGVYVRSPSGKLLPSQEGPIPPGVATVTGIYGAMELLFGK